MKVGDTLVFNGKKVLSEKDNFIRADYFNEAGLNTTTIGTRCGITKIFQSTFVHDYEMVTLDCPNGEYDFLMDAVRDNFIRCPREAAFEILF